MTGFGDHCDIIPLRNVFVVVAIAAAAIVVVVVVREREKSDRQIQMNPSSHPIL